MAAAQLLSGEPLAEATAGNKPESNPPPRSAGLRERVPALSCWWMLGLRGDGLPAEDEADITVPAEAAPLRFPFQERGI